MRVKDAWGKATGRGNDAADQPGMLFVKILRNDLFYERMVYIDVSRAERL